MVACDGVCEDWFHTNCLRRRGETHDEEKFYCQPCSEAMTQKVPTAEESIPAKLKSDERRKQLEGMKSKELKEVLAVYKLKEGGAKVALVDRIISHEYSQFPWDNFDKSKLEVMNEHQVGLVASEMLDKFVNLNARKQIEIILSHAPSCSTVEVKSKLKDKHSRLEAFKVHVVYCFTGVTGRLTKEKSWKDLYLPPPAMLTDSKKSVISEDYHLQKRGDFSSFHFYVLNAIRHWSGCHIYCKLPNGKDSYPQEGWLPRASNGQFCFIDTQRLYNILCIACEQMSKRRFKNGTITYLSSTLYDTQYENDIRKNNIAIDQRVNWKDILKDVGTDKRT